MELRSLPDVSRGLKLWRGLLILDNVDDGCDCKGVQALVAKLLATKELRVLCTARQRSGVFNGSQGERLIDVSPLSEYDAARLFRELALEVLPPDLRPPGALIGHPVLRALAGLPGAICQNAPLLRSGVSLAELERELLRAPARAQAPLALAAPLAPADMDQAADHGGQPMAARAVSKDTQTTLASAGGAASASPPPPPVVSALASVAVQVASASDPVFARGAWHADEPRGGAGVSSQPRRRSAPGSALGSGRSSADSEGVPRPPDGVTATPSSGPAREERRGAGGAGGGDRSSAAGGADTTPPEGPEETPRVFLTIPLEESGEQRVGDSTATPPVAEPSAVYASTHCSGGDRDDGDGGDGESSSAIAGAGGAGTPSEALHESQRRSVQVLLGLLRQHNAAAYSLLALLSLLPGGATPADLDALWSSSADEGVAQVIAEAVQGGGSPSAEAELPPPPPWGPLMQHLVQRPDQPPEAAPIGPPADARWLVRRRTLQLGAAASPPERRPAMSPRGGDSPRHEAGMSERLTSYISELDHGVLDPLLPTPPMRLLAGRCARRLATLGERFVALLEANARSEAMAAPGHTSFALPATSGSPSGRRSSTTQGGEIADGVSEGVEGGEDLARWRKFFTEVLAPNLWACLTDERLQLIRASGAAPGDCSEALSITSSLSDSVGGGGSVIGDIGSGGGGASSLVRHTARVGEALARILALLGRREESASAARRTLDALQVLEVPPARLGELRLLLGDQMLQLGEDMSAVQEVLSAAVLAYSEAEPEGGKGSNASDSGYGSGGNDDDAAHRSEGGGERDADAAEEVAVGAAVGGGDPLLLDATLFPSLSRQSSGFAPSGLHPPGCGDDSPAASAASATGGGASAGSFLSQTWPALPLGRRDSSCCTGSPPPATGSLSGGVASDAQPAESPLLATTFTPGAAVEGPAGLWRQVALMASGSERGRRWVSGLVRALLMLGDSYIKDKLNQMDDAIVAGLNDLTVAERLSQRPHGGLADSAAAGASDSLWRRASAGLLSSPQLAAPFALSLARGQMSPRSREAHAADLARADNLYREVPLHFPRCALSPHTPSRPNADLHS